MPQSRLPLFNWHFCLKCSKHYFVSSYFLCKFQMFQSKMILPKLPTSLRGACVSCCRVSHRHWVQKTSWMVALKRKETEMNWEKHPWEYLKGLLPLSLHIHDGIMRPPSLKWGLRAVSSLGQLGHLCLLWGERGLLRYKSPFQTAQPGSADWLVAPSAGQAPHRRSSSHLVAAGIAHLARCLQLPERKKKKHAFLGKTRPSQRAESTPGSRVWPPGWDRVSPASATSHNIKRQISSGHQLRRSYNRMGTTTTNGTLVAL